MNRTSRHELAERHFIDTHAHLIADSRWVPSHTKGPFDFAIYRPNGSSGVRTIFFEVKTWTKRKKWELSPAEKVFGKWAEYHSTPYVVLVAQVRNDRVTAEEMHRPFSSAAMEISTVEEVLA